MNRSISSVLVLLFGALVTALSLAYQSGPDDKSLPDPNQVYTPSDEEKARAESLPPFEGRWIGRIVPLVDRNGTLRDYPDGLEIRMYIEGETAYVDLLLNGEWQPIIGEDSTVQKNRSSIQISSFGLNGGYTDTMSISLHRAEQDSARIWFTRTAGTPFRSGDDIWKSWSVFAEGEVKYLP